MTRAERRLGQNSPEPTSWLGESSFSIPPTPRRTPCPMRTRPRRPRASRATRVPRPMSRSPKAAKLPTPRPTWLMVLRWRIAWLMVRGARGRRLLAVAHAARAAVRRRPRAPVFAGRAAGPAAAKRRRRRHLLAEPPAAAAGRRAAGRGGRVRGAPGRATRGSDAQKAPGRRGECPGAARRRGAALARRRRAPARVAGRGMDAARGLGRVGRVVGRVLWFLTRWDLQRFTN